MPRGQEHALQEAGRGGHLQHRPATRSGTRWGRRAENADTRVRWIRSRSRHDESRQHQRRSGATSDSDQKNTSVMCQVTGESSRSSQMLSYTPLGMPWKNSGMSAHQPPVLPHSQGASSSMVGFFTKRMSLRPLRICLHQRTHANGQSQHAGRHCHGLSAPGPPRPGPNPARPDSRRGISGRTSPLCALPPPRRSPEVAKPCSPRGQAAACRAARNRSCACPAGAVLLGDAPRHPVAPWSRTRAVRPFRTRRDADACAPARRRRGGIAH